MSAQITINPLLTTNAVDSFGVESVGLIQGTYFDDPAVRFALSGGILSSSETLPMWGGVGIFEQVPYSPHSSTQSEAALGGLIGRATTLTTTSATGLTGFSVFNQAHGMINTPQSPVPLAPSLGQVNFFRLGSGARIGVKMAPSLISLEGGIITQQVSWDFTAQELVPYTPAYAGATITGVSWAATAGGQTTFTVSTDLTGDLSAGAIIDVSGVVSTGGTGVGYNGNFVVVSVTSTTVVVTQVSASSPGTYSSGGTIAGAGGALPVKILRVFTSNCMTVDYDDTTGFATWNRSGVGAVVQI